MPVASHRCVVAAVLVVSTVATPRAHGLQVPDQPTQTTNTAAATLANVKLKSFTATPSAVGPFASSTLAWSVTPQSGFALNIGDQTLHAQGYEVVQPILASNKYDLEARAGGISRLLGTVYVTVDLSTCRRLGHGPKVMETLLDLVNGSALSDSTLYFATQFQNKPVAPSALITFPSNTIHIVMHLRQKSGHWYVADPSIDLTLDMGLGAQDSILVAVNPQAHADISAPLYLWVVPGAMIGIPIAEDDGKAKAEKKGLGALAQLVGFFQLEYGLGNGQGYYAVAIVGTPITDPVNVTGCSTFRLAPRGPVSQPLSH